MFRFGSSERKSLRKGVRPQLELLEDRTVPAVFNVAAGDVGTLIADMNQANSNGQSNIINLTAGTYDLTAVDNNWYGPNGLPAITSNLTINGNGAVLVRDSSLGQNTPFRLLYVSGGLTPNMPAGSLTLEDITLEGGLAKGGDSGTGGGGLGAGGAIFNQGTLVLNAVTVTQNTAMGGSSGMNTGWGGGGIGQDGQGDNGGGFGGTPTGGGTGGNGASSLPATSGGGGGGFSQNGANASISAAGSAGGASEMGGAGGNSTDAGGDGGGGGSGAGGSTGGAGGAFGFGGNGASTGGGGGGGVGGGGGDGTGNPAAGVFTGGGGGGFGGGGGGSSFLGGTGGFGGGGGASLSSGTGAAGGFGGGNGSSSSGGGGAGMGGAIFNMYGTTTLINSTLAANMAQGGSGGANANGGGGYGGAIFNLDGTVNLTTSTLASNSIAGAANGGGAVYNLALGQTTLGQPVQAVVNLTDSILATSVGGNDLVNDQSNSPAGTAVVNATTPNIVMVTSTINGATTNGTPNTANPLLGLLGNYSGLTPTMALMSESPALAVGTGGANIPLTDQRGNSRGSLIDLGAYQQTSAQTVGTTVALTTNSASVAAGQPVTFLATVSVPPSAQVLPVGSVQFVDTTTGATLGSAGLAIVNGQVQAIFSTTLGTGTHTIAATYMSANRLGNSTASATVTVGSSNQLWLEHAYRDILGRDVDPSGLAFWNAVIAGGTSRGVVAYMLQTSTEYHADQIQAAFQTLLHRPADNASLSYFVGVMNQGASIEQIDGMLAGSDEYFQVRGGGTIPGFLAAIYQDFLHRNVDPTGLQVWQQALAAGQSRTQVVMDVLGTSEYKTDVVNHLYQTYLHRNPDSASLSAFVNYLIQGGSDAAVAAVLIGSQEYLNNATA